MKALGGETGMIINVTATHIHTQKLTCLSLHALLTQMPALWRVTALKELLRWFEAPNSLVEIFLNYDMDRKFTRQWKVFEQMVNVFCAIAEGRGEVRIF